MTTMNISLPDSLRALVDEQVARGGFGSTSEYVRDLIRRDLEQAQLRDLLLEGAASQPEVEANEAFYDALRERARKPMRG
jgi:antitoxin ParD1/3/4